MEPLGILLRTMGLEVEKGKELEEAVKLINEKLPDYTIPKPDGMGTDRLAHLLYRKCLEIRNATSLIIEQEKPR